MNFFVSSRLLFQKSTKHSFCFETFCADFTAVALSIYFLHAAHRAKSDKVYKSKKKKQYYMFIYAKKNFCSNCNICLFVIFVLVIKCCLGSTPWGAMHLNQRQKYMEN